MSGEELQVVPEDLAGKAGQIRGLSWSSQTAQPALISPDALVISSVAVTNLAVNAENLWAYQEFGRLEGLRLAQTLDNVAGAYAQVDQSSGDDIGSTIGGPGGPQNGTVYPKGVDLPAPPHPPKMPIPKGQLASDQGVMYPPAVQTALDSGDDGASLRAAAAMWQQNAQSLAASAEQFEVNSLNWEGEAADAAYAKFNSYRDWLVSLSGSWKRLAEEANRLATAHSKAKEDHRPIADRYESLEQQVVQNPPGSPAFNDAMNQMAQLQTQSEDLRNGYARDAQPDQIEAEDPPPPVMSGIPVRAEDHKHARPYRPQDNGQPGSGGGQQAPAGGGGGDAPAQAAPPDAPASPTSAADEAAQQGGGSPSEESPGGGSPGGGSPGGGSPGGSPSGGMPGGMPGLGKGEPKLPNDPHLRPAAAGGGGGGAGAGGGGGGGMPGSPLQPAVGAETVAPTPVAAQGHTAAPGGASGASGAAGGGGMGGMAPMMHGGQGGSSDKKRNPQLSQDEDLYTEDRPWTEAVIGNRVRRRGAADDTKKESQ